MKLRSLTIAAVALGALLAIPVAAQAYPAQTTGSLNVRAGPGVGYHRIGVLPPGAVVEVRHCRSRWCNIWYRGGSAWVSGSYLRGVRHFVPQQHVRPLPFYRDRYRYHRRRPGLYFHFRFGP